MDRVSAAAYLAGARRLNGCGHLSQPQPKEFVMNEKSQLEVEVVELGDAKEATKGDHTPVYMEENPHILGKPEA